MSIARHHAEWLSLVEASGPFLSLPVLLQAFPQGLDAPDADFCSQLRLAHPEWQAGNFDPALHRAWFDFIRRGLDWPASLWREDQAIPGALKLDLPAYGETVRPDGVLLGPGDDGGEEKPRLLWNFYPPAQGLEKSCGGRGWNAWPSVRMAELLRATGVRLGLISNGENWMLVHAAPGQMTSYISWTATLWNEERLTWRAFTSLLGGRALFGRGDEDSLETLFERSLENQQEVTDQLGVQVRRALERLVATFERENQNTGGYLLRDQSPREIYEAALAVMMRLVFLFCAEERGMLPLDQPFYAQNYAVSTLRASLREVADAWGEEFLERQFDAWCRLLATFRVVYGGIEHERCPLIAYGGNLFNPNRYPWLEGREVIEGEEAEWEGAGAEPLPVDNRTVLHLLEALQILETRVPGGGTQARVVSFRALDIEQIGHVYEGLLDHTVLRAETEMVSLKGAKNDEPEIALEVLETLSADPKKLLDFLAKQTGRSKSALENDLKDGAGLDDIGPLNRVCVDENLTARVMPFAGLLRRDSFGLPVVIHRGNLFVTRGSDRRSSGTHYTPRTLTEPLVAQTLDPLVYRGLSEGVPASPETLRTPRELLDLKICDPACGSAGVLVQVCRYLSEKLVEAWEKGLEKVAGADKGPLFLPYAESITLEAMESGSRPLPLDLDERALEARRLVADRCIYGVDRDPLAVDMAQLSLWLITMAKNRPFSFLEHAIRVGDSLAGVDLAQLRTQSLSRKSEGGIARVNFGSAINAARTAREEIHTLGDDESAKRAKLQEALHQVENAKLLADSVVAPSFGALKRAERAATRKTFQGRFQGISWSDEWRAELRNDLDTLLGEVKPFHWPLEFPDAFFRDSHASENEQAGTPQNGGFDAIVGNPPFIGGQRITGALGVPYRDYLIESLARGKKGSADLVAYFYLRAFDLLRRGGTFGLIATNTIAQGDTREVGLDQICEAAQIFAANPSQKWPGTAALEVALVHVVKGAWQAPCDLAGKSVAAITPYLSAPGAISGNPHRLRENAGKSFQGSIVLGMGFVLTPDAARELIERDPKNAEVLQPYLNGEDLNSRPDASPSRWVINFKDWPLNRETAPADYEGSVAADYPDCLEIVERLVKPEREKQNRESRAKKWWQYAERSRGLYEAITDLPRVLIRAQVSRTHAPSFVESGWVYSMMCVVFVIESNSEFAVLQSNLHEAWLNKFSSSLKSDQRYTPSDCFETFPFPRLNGGMRLELETLGRDYHALRRSICLGRALGLTKVYNAFHDPKTSGDAAWNDIESLRTLHRQMDESAARAYGWDDLVMGHDFHPTAQGVRFTLSDAARREVLDRLLALNHARFAEEVAGGLHDKKAPKNKGKKEVQMGLAL